MSNIVNEVTLTLERRDQPPPLGAVLRVLNATASPVEYRLSAGSCRVGAARGAEIVIADETVSRLHAEFELVPEGIRVTDLGSRNGTFYLGQRVEKIVLGLGSQIRLGRTELSITADAKLLEEASNGGPKRYGALVGSSPVMRQLFAMLRRLEGSLVNVLIEGESGTGKELIARGIHEHSQVSDGPFVAVNCGAIDRSLARSELFGHKRGAFTGALEASVGAFEAAHGGTLFLDEIGELPLDIQPLLLRALETSSVTRVGETTPRPVKVRLLAATNRDLAEEVKKGNFREDLYYRIVVVKLGVPALRERLDDLRILAEQLAPAAGLAEVTPEVLAELRSHTWPGNVRELKNALHAYAALGTLQLRSAPASAELGSAIHQFIDVTKPYAEQKDALLQIFLQNYLDLLLAHTNGNQSEAARISGLERSYLGRLLGKLQERKAPK